MNLLKILIFKKEFQVGRRLGSSERIFTRNPLALIGVEIFNEDVRLLQTLTSNKWPPGVDPCGHNFAH
jgi:hypothetical protein